MDSSISEVVDVETKKVGMCIRNATESLARKDFGVLTRDFHFAGQEWRLLLRFEGGNLVLHLLRKDSGDLKVHQVFYGVGIENSNDRVIHHWQEAKWPFESPDATAWIGPSKTDLLQNTETLLGNDYLFIWFAMSTSSPSLSGTFRLFRKEPTKKSQSSAASNPTAVKQEGFDNREEYSLSLNSRALRSLSENLKDLYLKDKDHDVKIIIGDKTLIAHRAILKVRSPVLSRMFSHDTSEAHTGEVRLEDCHADDFAVFLLFLYSGRVEGLTNDNVLHVYDIAEKYEVPELVEACTQHMISHLTVYTVIDVIGLALQQDDIKFLQEAIDFFVKHAVVIFHTVEWQRFLADKPTQANELVIKSVTFMQSQNV